MAKYVYPAIFEQEADGGYVVNFPDIDGCFTQGDDINEALLMAEDVLNAMLWTLEDHRKTIPAPMPIKDISVEDDAFVSYVHADTVAYRKKCNPQPVRRTLSIPQWLDQMALDANINFSQVLQDALAEKLHLA